MSKKEKDEELLKQFCEYAASKGKKTQATKKGNSSLILNLLQQQREALYEQCGFDKQQAKDLDKLLAKVEETSLPKMISLYDSFKMQNDVERMYKCTVNLTRLPDMEGRVSGTQPGVSGTQSGSNVVRKRGRPPGVKKSKETPTKDTSSKQIQRTPSKQKRASTSAILSSEKRDQRTEMLFSSPGESDTDVMGMGRGKRKKIAKIKFEFSEEETKPKALLAKSAPPRVDADRRKLGKQGNKQSTPISRNQNKSIKDSKADVKNIINTPQGVQSRQSQVSDKSTKKRKSLGKTAGKSSNISSSKKKKQKLTGGMVYLDVDIKEEPLDPDDLDLGLRPIDGGATINCGDTAENVQEALMNGEDVGSTEEATGAEVSEEQQEGGDEVVGLQNQAGESVVGASVVMYASREGDLPAELGGDDGEQSMETVAQVGGVDQSEAQEGTNTVLAVGDSSEKTNAITAEVEGVLSQVIDSSDLEQLCALKNTCCHEDIAKDDSGKENQAVELDDEVEIIGVEKAGKRRKGRGPQKAPRRLPFSMVPIICSECNMRYSTYTTLRRHWAKAHPNCGDTDSHDPPNILLCRICNDKFPAPRPFLRHYRAHAVDHDLTKVDKYQPFKATGERSDFECDKKAPITCSICRELIQGEGAIYSHWKKEHRKYKGEKPPPLFYCDQCHCLFDAPRKFKIHYRMHTGARPHKCDQCPKEFRTFADLQAHMTSHSNERPYKCDHCNQCLVSKKVLSRHLRGHMEPVMCDVCGKSYPSKHSLKLHMKIHTGEKPFKCDICGVSFTQAGSLKLHRRLHVGQKPHVCQDCGMRFNSNSHLVTHRRVHTGEKPYKCTKCNYAAASSSRLKDHEAVHREDKPYICKVPGCGRRYKRMSHLIFHHSKHEGINPYKCNRCGLRFKMSSMLMLHKRKDNCELNLELVLKMEEEENNIINAANSHNDLIRFGNSVTAAGTTSAVGTNTAYVTTDDDQQTNTIEVIFQNEQGEPFVKEEAGEEGGITYIYHTTEEGGDVVGLDAATTTQTYEVIEAAADEQQQTMTQQLAVVEGVEGGEPYEQQIVIQIVREPGQEDEDFVLSKEELERIVRLSQQM